MVVKLAEKKLKTGKVSLVLRYSIGGKRKEETTGLCLLMGKSADVKSVNAKTLKEAEKLRLKKELALAEDKADGPKVPKLLDYWHTVYLRNRGMYSWNTCLKWKNAKDKLEMYLNERAQLDIKVSEVSVGMLEDYKLWLQTSNVHSKKTNECKPAAVNCVISKLSFVLHRAAEEDLIKQSVANRKITMKLPQKEVDFLTDLEVQKLVEGKEMCKYPFVYYAIRVGLLTGLRISDMEQLKWEHIVDGEIRKTTQKTKYKLVMPISTELSSVLADCKSELGDDEYVLGDLSKKSTTSRRLLKEYFEACGVSSASRGWHVLRHSFSVNCLSANVSPYIVSRLLGHANLDTIRAYANVKTDTLGEAIRQVFG